MSLNKNVLKSILNKNLNFCGVCFETLEESSVHIHDEVTVVTNGKENTLKVLDMLFAVLGEQIVGVMAIFKHLCKQCFQSAVTSYKFVNMSKHNVTALKITVENLSSCIQEATENNYACKSLFITIDPQTYTTQEYFDIMSPTTSMSSPQKIDTYVNYNEDNTINNEPEKKVRKKKSSSSSFHLKTTDMLYDKNDPTNLQCKVCQRIYPFLSNLRNHYIRVHAPKKFKCSTCDRKFGSMGLLEQHKYQSHCTLVCSECGKTFYNRHTLKMHEIGHYIRIVCEDCGRVYKSQTTYKKHIDLNVCGRRGRASPSDAKFTCDYCNKKYTQKASLRVHIQYEHGNYKSHVCKWCNKKFWAQSRLQAHIVKHTQEKKFSCNICNGKFVTKESLLYHTRIHTGEKPYQCYKCDKSFLSASRRADHIKRHHSSATCEVCNTQFPTHYGLEKHKKIHTNTITKKDEQNVPDIFGDEDHFIYFSIPARDTDVNQSTVKINTAVNKL